MKRSLLVAFALAAACSALAQTNPRLSPAGEPPVLLRQGRPRLVGHFNPKQMLRLAFGLSHPHMAEEEQFIQELVTSGSPNFHRFLTADEWNARFAPSAADEQAVVDWAVSEGLTITHRFKNRLIVNVEAPVGTIERALGVTINSYAYENFFYYSNECEPAVPGHLSDIIHSIGGLNNLPEMKPAGFHGTQPPGPVYRPGPLISEGHTRHADGDGSRKVEGLSSRSANLLPNFTSGLIDPENIYSSYAYNYDGLQNLGLCCNPFHAGGGSPSESSIALATFGKLHWNGTDFTDVLGFHNTHTYLAYNITTYDLGAGDCTVGPSQPCNNDAETTLDAEWSTATSNSFGSYLDTAHVYVYESGGDAETMYNTMLSDGHARVFSTSWSCTEDAGCASGSTMDTRHGIFNAMAAQGWTLMTASGDRGATDDCSSVNVSYPASDPDVIGVGGTLLGLYNDGTFASEVTWTGGTSANSCSNNNGGSGGGCSVHFDNPTYPNGLTLSNGTCGSKRSVPDISLNAAAGQDFYWNGSLSGVGGTSISSPMLAGFFAQAEAYLLYIGGITGNDCGSNHLPCTPIGFATPYIHFFGQNANYAPHYPFYDITSGCNSNDITAASNLSFFCSGSGYDSVTGWGTANMLQFSWALNTYFAGSFAAPAASFSGPGINVWHNTPQTINWTLSAVSNAANNGKANGIAGYTENWDSDPGDDTSRPTPGTGSNYYAGPAYPLATSGSMGLDGSSGGEGCHTLHVRTWDNGGTTADRTYGPVCFDDIPPFASCASPDGLWHATDVSLHCTAGDTFSGLANSADASFNVTTSVLAGTDNSNAFTNSRTIFDVAGNFTTRGPLGPNMVDKKPPVVGISSPTATQYTHSSTLTLNFSVTDGTGSGVNTITPTMDGSGTIGGSPITNGMTINLLTTLPLGSNTFAVGATDNVGNPNSASVTFTIMVTAQSMIDDVKQFFASGAISDPAVYQGLLDKLNAALAARNKGNCKTAGNNYSAFISQVQGQIGKGITAQAAAILIADAQYLIAHCP
jgi:hypothetical protein